MELQWPLILFTTFMAWSAGLFGTQCLVSLKGEGAKAQLPALITSVVLMIIGGVAVFMHLQHWERIFNGFGHITSGITQELIAIVLLFVVMVVFFVFARREGAKIPAWVAILGIVLAVVLVVVMAHSYMMESRPAWNTVTWILCVLGNALILGPATFMLIDEMTAGDAGVSALGAITTLAGSVINAVLSVVYLVAANGTSASLLNWEYYSNPTTPTVAPIDTTTISVFSGDTATMAIVTIIAAILPIACAFMGKKQGNWKVWGTAAVVCALVGAITVRVVFYQMGVAVFSLY